MAQQLLQSVILPALLAGAIALAGAGRAARARIVVGAAAAALGLLVCFGFEAGVAALVPRERWHWIAVIGAGAAAVGALLPSRSGRPLACGFLCLVLATGTGVLIRPPGLDTLAARIVLAIVAGALFAALLPLARREHTAVPTVALALAAAAASVVLLQSRNARLSMIAAALAAMAVALAIVSALAGRGAMGGGIAVYAATLPSLLLLGAAYDYGDLPRACFALPAAAAAVPCLRRAVPATRCLRGWRATLTELVPAAALGAVAVALALGATASAPDDPYAGY